jgi:7-carboxy-7-deazaguanine synthase
MKNIIPIHETFQSTLQGEGYWTGALTDFIRLSGCPLKCHFCDTGYADGGKNTPRQQIAINELINELKSPRVVITGGEPFLHDNLPDLVQAILDTGRQVSIETSGAFWQDISCLAWVTLSPKQHLNERYPVKPEMWLRADELKIVISNGTELDYYKSRGHLRKAKNQWIYLQPEWNDRDRTIPITLDLIRQHTAMRLSLQTHKLLNIP